MPINPACPRAFCPSRREQIAHPASVCSARLLALETLEVAVAELGLAGSHLDGDASDPDLLGDRRDFEGIAGPEGEIGNLALGDATACGAEAEDVRRGCRERGERDVGRKSVRDGVACNLPHAIWTMSRRVLRGNR